MQYLKAYQSPIGRITLASDGEFIIGLWFDGQKYDRAGLSAEYMECMETEVAFAEAEKWLDLYFAGKDPGFLPPVKLSGSEFRQTVGRIMLEIPFGETRTYKEIGAEAAKRLGKSSMSAQAVGGAVGHNPISVIVPCHRVVGTNGSLTGYAGGLEKKLWLLRNEGIEVCNEKIGARNEEIGACNEKIGAREEKSDRE